MALGSDSAGEVRDLERGWDVPGLGDALGLGFGRKGLADGLGLGRLGRGGSAGGRWARRWRASHNTNGGADAAARSSIWKVPESRGKEKAGRLRSSISRNYDQSRPRPTCGIVQVTRVPLTVNEKDLKRHARDRHVSCGGWVAARLWAWAGWAGRGTRALRERLVEPCKQDSLRATPPTEEVFPQAVLANAAFVFENGLIMFRFVLLAQ